MRNAKKDVRDIRKIIATRIASELTDERYLQFHRAFSPGLQEYVEASLFLGYLEHQRLRSCKELEAELAEECSASGISFNMRLLSTDYILGAADLTGEVMRLCIDAQANGDYETPFETKVFMQKLCAAMESLQKVSPLSLRRDWQIKRRTWQQSLQKVETSCYAIRVRLSEFDAQEIQLQKVEGGEPPRKIARNRNQ